MVLLEGNIVWENLRTAFVDVDELLLFLKRHEFNGYFHFTFSDCECVLFLHEGDVVNGLEERIEERLCGQVAVHNILERSHQDKQGAITVKQLPSSTVGLLSRVYLPTVKLMHTDIRAASEPFVGFVSRLKKERFTGYLELLFTAENKQGIVSFNDGKIKAILTEDLLADLKEESEAELKFIQSFIERAQKTGVEYEAYGQE
jgi:hypothetical protein